MSGVQPFALSFFSQYRCFASPFRCFASLFRSFVVLLFHIALSLFRIALSFFRSLTLVVLQSRFFASPFRCFALSLFRTFLFCTLVVSHSRGLACSLFLTYVGLYFVVHTFVVSYFRCFEKKNSLKKLNTFVNLTRRG